MDLRLSGWTKRGGPDKDVIAVGAEIILHPGGALADAGNGLVNFGAGAANAVTSTVTLGNVHVNAPFHGPGLGGSYMVGECTVWAEAALYSAGRLPYNPESARFGWSSRLFGRGGDPAKTFSTQQGILNRGPVRVGWGWKEGTGEVFRVGIGPARRYHIDIWTNLLP